MKGELIVIALGGNAIKQPNDVGTTEEQFANVDKTAAQIAQIVKAGYEPVITHGNGPQVGSLLIQQEEASRYVPAQTLAVCGAMTQGAIGWMIQNRLAYHLKNGDFIRNVCAMVTQVAVDSNDPDFKDPSKPIGPFYTAAEAEELKKTKNYQMKHAKPGADKGWRRVVPSPEPVFIVEREAIKQLVEQDIVVIASGGGGIPVKHEEDGSFSGIDAVIDKDRAGFVLAKDLDAQKFIILTDVENVCINYGTPEQVSLGTITLKEAEEYMAQGHFLAGSMGPKVEAAVKFVKWKNKEAIITSLDKALDAIEGKTGTRIIP